MRLDHLLSKDWLCGVASWSCVVWIVEWVWAGWGSALAEGRAADCVSWVCSRGWLVCLVIGVGNTPVMLLLPACVGSVAWWVPLRACVRVGVACCRGSGAVRPGLPGPSRVPFLGVLGGCGWVGCELYSGREHLTVRFLRQSVSCFVRVSLLFVFLSVRWMPWHQGPMKDVVACDIPRGAGWRAVIRGFPNGGTRHELCRVTCI